MIHPDDPLFTKRFVLVCLAPNIPKKNKNKKLCYSRPATWNDISLGDLAEVLSAIIREPYREEWKLFLSTGRYLVRLREPDQDDVWQLPVPKEKIKVVRWRIHWRTKKVKRHTPIIVRDDINSKHYHS